MSLRTIIDQIKITGARGARKVFCPYCQQEIKFTLIPHLRKAHPLEWASWSDEFVRMFREDGDPKRIMRMFTSTDGRPVLSWTVIHSEIKAKINKPEPGGFGELRGKLRISPTIDEYKSFKTTIWDVPRRGSWATHQSNYQGNWPPQLVRRLLELYSKPGDLVVDPFVGGGTTILECLAMGRHSVGFDVAPIALTMATSRVLEFRTSARQENLVPPPDVKADIIDGSALDLPGIEDETVDMICTHPPYLNMVVYSDDHPDDLSRIDDPVLFRAAMQECARTFFRVLKPGGICAFMIGDMRRNYTLIPISFDAYNAFCEERFQPIEIIIKTKNNSRFVEFHAHDKVLRLDHEYIFIMKRR